MFPRRCSSLLLASLVLAGCSEAYVRPEPPLPSSWPTAVQASTGPLAPQIGWRNFFSDTRLQGLIATALEHNRDLRVAASRVEEARAQFGISRADRLPSINLGTKYNVALTPGNLGGSSQSVTGQSHDVSFSVISYEVDFWGRISGLADASRASYLASEEAQRAVRLTLISDVANAYFSMLELNERIEISRASLATRERSLDLVKQGHAAGFASKSDYLQADSAVEAVRSELASMQRERAVAANMLHFLVGRMPDQVPVGQPLLTQEINVDFAVGLPSEIILSRPDVLAAEQRLIAANANIGAARAAFLPKILLTGLFGSASKALVNLFTGSSQSWAFQPSITMPIFDGGRLAGNAELAEARKVTAVAEYEKTILQAFREVADLLAARSAFAEQLRSARVNLKNQEERVLIAEAMFKGGQISYLNVLDAQREHLVAQQAALQMYRSKLNAATQLYKALGGGASDA